MTTAAVLLAAGQSRRFGPEDKLLAPYLGKPLVSHAADAIRQLAPDHRIAVAGSPSVADHLSDFRVVAPAPGMQGQADSLRAGITEAMRHGTDRVLIVLGDMPGVTPGLLQDVLGKVTTAQPSAAFDGTAVMPPACFPSTWFDRILGLTGDQGAGSLLRGLSDGQRVRADPTTLRDIDTPKDL